MGTTSGLFGRLKERQGVTVVIACVLIVVLIGFTALAIDAGHLFVVRGEMQNAADAGALAGARLLFNIDENNQATVNTGANQIAHDVAEKNLSDKTPVEVDLGTGDGNDKDVIRGHWDSVTNTFTESTDENSTDPSYINAIKVTTHRSAAFSFFARIFGFENFPVRASAIAYRPYAGINFPYDQPIAICEDKILDEEGNYSCTKGRMIHSGNANPQSVETARWTNFSDECLIPANKPNVSEKICIPDPPERAVTSVSTINGEVTPAMSALYNCWVTATGKNVPWELLLPVVKCDVPVTCSQVVSPVGVKVLWITGTGADPQFNDIPVTMTDGDDSWSQTSNCLYLTTDNTKENRKKCWYNFVEHFGIVYIDENGDEKPAVYVPVTLYFKPSCEKYTDGQATGEHFNVYALYPKLVK